MVCAPNREARGGPTEFHQPTLLLVGVEPRETLRQSSQGAGWRYKPDVHAAFDPVDLLNTVLYRNWTLNVERKRCRHPASLAERSAADRRLFLGLGVLKYCESNLEEGVAEL
ncbi:uncharacterized protein LOC144378022 isoform X2 [Ictidomys tridecemlineatus]